MTKDIFSFTKYSVFTKQNILLAVSITLEIFIGQNYFKIIINKKLDKFAKKRVSILIFFKKELFI